MAHLLTLLSLGSEVMDSIPIVTHLAIQPHWLIGLIKRWQNSGFSLGMFHNPMPFPKMSVGKLFSKPAWWWFSTLLKIVLPRRLKQSRWVADPVNG